MICLVFNATFSYIMATSFSGGRRLSIRREPPTIGKQLSKLYHLRLRVECTLVCSLQNRASTHAVLVIGLYELLGNPTTQLIEPPGPVNSIIEYSYVNGTCDTLLGYHMRDTKWNPVHKYLCPMWAVMMKYFTIFQRNFYFRANVIFQSYVWFGLGLLRIFLN